MNKTTEALKLAEEIFSGMLHGTDWNNGTHANIYRPKFPKALAAIREVLAEPVCKRCNGTKLVSDGEIDNIGGVDLEVPIECVKDCPDCAKPVKQEPVAWAYIDADGSFMDALDRQHGAYQTPLYAAPVNAKAIREEAAKACEAEQFEVLEDESCEPYNVGCRHCAAAIRGLK